MSIVIRVKVTAHNGFTTAKQAKVIDFLQGDKFKVRFNEAETSLKAKERILEWEKTAHHIKGDGKTGDYSRGDVLKFTVRSYEAMKLPNRAEFSMYPFESLTFDSKIELSGFEIDKQEYIFDIYRSLPEKEVTVASDVDGLPAYSLDYKRTIQTSECEQGPIRYFMPLNDEEIDPDKPDDRKVLEGLSFPVSRLSIKLERDPIGALTSFLWPTLVQASFAFKCLEIDDAAERQANLSIPLLAVGGILTLLKSQLPQLEGSTLLEKFILLYSIFMMFPLVRNKTMDNYI